MENGETNVPYNQHNRDWFMDETENVSPRYDILPEPEAVELIDTTNSVTQANLATDTSFEADTEVLYLLNNMCFNFFLRF